MFSEKRMDQEKEITGMIDDWFDCKFAFTKARKERLFLNSLISGLIIIHVLCNRIMRDGLRLRKQSDEEKSSNVERSRF